MARLTSEEVEAFVAREGLVRLATVADDGWPLVVPLGYAYRDRRVLLTARERVSWLANIRRDPRVCLSIDESRYPLRKVTIRGHAEVVFEPGEDDEWRELRLPIADSSTVEPAPGVTPREWSYDAAYRVMTHDEPRALVAVPLDGSTVTSWRMPVEGELLEGSWSPRYYSRAPRRFRVTTAGPRMSDVRVVEEQ